MMNKATRPVLAGAVIAALTLTGCSSWPGAGAEVQTVRVADQQVVDTAKVIVDVTGVDNYTALRQAAFDLTLGEASRQIVAAKGVEISAADKAAALAGSPAAQAISANPVGAPWGDAVATATLAIDKVGQDDFVEAIRGLDIRINPRYGTWSPQQMTMVDSSLSTSVDALRLNR